MPPRSKKPNRITLGDLLDSTSELGPESEFLMMPIPHGVHVTLEYKGGELQSLKLLSSDRDIDWTKLPILEGLQLKIDRLAYYRVEGLITLQSTEAVSTASISATVYAAIKSGSRTPLRLVCTHVHDSTYRPPGSAPMVRANARSRDILTAIGDLELIQPTYPIDKYLVVLCQSGPRQDHHNLQSAWTLSPCEILED